MATTIKLKNSVTTTNAPSSLVQGEVAINITDKKVWVGNAATTPIQLLGAGSSASFGALTCTSLTNSGLTSGRVTYAGASGLLQDSANFTFNGTTVTMANDASISGLTVGKGGGAISNNTVVGLNAGVANTTGKITAVGYLAARFNTTGSGNTAVGGNDGAQDGALYLNTTGSYNIAMGTGAVASNTTGSYNTGIGYSALQNNTTASNNTAVGYQALYTNSTGTSNVSVGNLALGQNTTGSYNTSVGAGIAGVTWGSLGSNTTGSYNTALGYQALLSNTTADNNTAVGYQALYSNTTGAINTAIGNSALRNVTTSNDNTALGYYAGYYSTALTTGSQNVLLGAYTRTSAATSTYQFVIGYDVAGQADNNVTIGSASGKIYNAFTVNATWTQTSDGRLKKNIQEETLGLSFINRLRPVKYEWKASNELDKDNPYYSEENKRTTGVVMHGLIAQEVKEALDAEGVSTFAGWDEGEDGIQAISREMFITPLIKAIQELKAEVDSLKAQLNK